MPKYVIERLISHAGILSRRDLIAISQKSNRVLNDINGKGSTKIQWQKSYVTDSHVYCVYIADNKNVIVEHGKKGEFR